MSEFRGYCPEPSEQKSDGVMGKVSEKTIDFVKKHPWLTTAAACYAFYKMNGNSFALEQDYAEYDNQAEIESQASPSQIVESKLANGGLVCGGVVSNEVYREVIIDNGERRELYYYVLESDKAGTSRMIASFDELPGCGLDVFVVGEVIKEDQFYGQDYYEDGILLVDKVIYKNNSVEEALYERK